MADMDDARLYESWANEIERQIVEQSTTRNRSSEKVRGVSIE